MTTLARDARRIFEAGVRRVEPVRLLNEVDWPAWAPRALGTYRRVEVVGMGKAAAAMAEAVETRLGDRIDGGVVVAPADALLPQQADAPPRRIAVMTGGHPLPDAHSQAGARAVLERAGRLGPDDLLLVLISGGGTALAADFSAPITLDDARATYELLLRAGADIGAMNIVRKHLSQIGGGRLAHAARPSEVLALVVSDVVGDDLSVIASGPTVPDPSTFADALEIVKQEQVWSGLPRTVRAHLERGVAGEADETPKPGDPLFARVRTEIVGSNAHALEAAADEARRLGYDVARVEGGVTGEARDVGRRLAHILARTPVPRPTCCLWGGETTVVVRGGGRGGRNQELALAAARAFEADPATAARPLLLLSAGTDGRDGPTDAAGAWATPSTIARARALGLDADGALARNDAYPFWEALGQLVRTGATQTNVMDLQVGLALPGDEGRV